MLLTNRGNQLSAAVKLQNHCTWISDLQHSMRYIMLKQDMKNGSAFLSWITRTLRGEGVDKLGAILAV